MSKDKKTQNTEQQTEANKKLNLTEKEKLEIYKEMNDKLLENNKLSEESSRATLERSAREMELAGILRDTTAQYEAANEFLKAKKEAMDDLIESEEDLATAEAKFAAQMGFTRDQMEKTEKEALKLKEAFEEMGEAGKAAQKKLRPMFQDMATHMGIVSQKGNKIVGNMISIGQFARSKGGIAGMKMAFKEVINPMSLAIGLLTNITQQTIKYALAVDEATASFAAQTGAGKALYNDIAEVGSNFRRFGISAKDAAKAAGDLFNAFPGFLNLSSQTREEMEYIVAGLEKLKVSGSDSSESIMFMSKNLGLAGAAAANATKEMAMVGKALGMSASKITKGFNKAMKSLAVYGKQAPKIFKGVAAAAQAAGVEVDDLLGLADKFDTFAGAAESTAKLNAIMGTQLSSTKMLMANEEERIEILMRTMQAQGKQFKNMDRFTQKAIAATVGIKDMSKAQKIFGMNLKEYRSFKDAAKDNAKAEEEFQERMMQAMSVVEKLKAAFMEFAITMGPFVEETLVPFIEKLAEWLSWQDGLLVKIGGVVAVFFVLTSILSTILGPIKALKVASFASAGGLIAQSKAIKKIAKHAPAAGISITATLVPAISALGAASTPAAVPVGALAVQMTALSKAVVAAGGLAALATATGTLGTAAAAANLPITALNGLIPLFGTASSTAAGGVSALGTAAGGASAGVWSFAGAMAGVAGALVLIALGIVAIILSFAYLVDIFVEAGDSAFQAAAGFFLIALGIAAITLALNALGSNPVSWAAVGILAGLFLGVIGAALAMASMAEAIGTMATELAKLGDVDLSKSIGELGPSLWKAQTQLQSLEAGSGVKITSVLENMALISTGTSAEKMKGAAGGGLAGALGSVVDSIMGLGKDKEKMKVTLKLDGPATEKLFKEAIADAEADTSFSVA